MKTVSTFITAACLAILFLAPSNLLATDTTKAASSMTDMASKAATVVEQLNINTASLESLAGIPGIGDKISEAIVTYREAHGAFKSVSDLVNIEGIDAGLLEKIKPFLTI